MSSEPVGVLFDLDGTLLDTLQDLADSGNEVVRAWGFPEHPVDAYRTFVGSGMRHLVQAIFPSEHRPESDAAIDEILEEYRAAYSRNWQRNTVPYPGVTELLDQLRDDGIPFGVVSNKAHDFTQKCVEAFLPDWEWGPVMGHREGFEKKPDPASALEAAAAMGVSPGRCCFVGDSDVDMETGKNAGMVPVGVSWGFRSVEELRAHGAAEILDQPGSLVSLLGELSTR
ncbi:MAG: HAD family hydrolase [Verrucomicrobiota bacterium]